MLLTLPADMKTIQTTGYQLLQTELNTIDTSNFH